MDVFPDLLTVVTRTMRGPRTLLAAASLLVAVMLSACGGQQALKHAQTETAAHQNSVSQVVVDMMVPTSGADQVTGTVALDSFFTGIAEKAEDACLAKSGFPPVGQSPDPPVWGQPDLPNLEYIRSKGGFGLLSGGSLPNTKGMSASEKRAYNADQKRCAPRFPELAVWSSAGTAIMTVWQHKIQSIADSPTVARYNRRGAQCSSGTRFAATSYADELRVAGDVADSEYMKQNMAAGRALEARGAAVFVRCFGPAVQRVDQALLKASKPFLARYATEIRSIQRRTARQVAEISAKYDAAWGSNTKRKSS